MSVGIAIRDGAVSVENFLEIVEASGLLRENVRDNEHSEEETGNEEEESVVGGIAADPSDSIDYPISSSRSPDGPSLGCQGKRCLECEGKGRSVKGFPARQTCQ